MTAGIAEIDRLRGSQGLSLRSIARTVGCSHVNLYYYFKDLAELRWHLYAFTLEDFRSYCYGRMNKATAPETRMQAFVRAVFDYATNWEGRYRLLWLDDLGGPPPDFVLSTISSVSGEYASISASEFGTGPDDAEGIKRGDIYFSWMIGQMMSLVSGRIIGTREDMASRIFAQAEMLERSLHSKLAPFGEAKI